jgi:hypothetical protein
MTSWRFPVLALAGVLSFTLSVAADAQRGPGRRFITTTDRRTFEVEGGSVTSTTTLAEAPSFALSALATAPLAKWPTRAWIVGARTSALNLGNTGGCVLVPPDRTCQNLRFVERFTLLTGGAFDVRTVMIRAMAGPSVYHVEQQGARVGTQLRIDFVTPRISGATPAIFLTRTFLGSQKGRDAQMTSLGASIRFMSGIKRERPPVE